MECTVKLFGDVHFDDFCVATVQKGIDSFILNTYGSQIVSLMHTIDFRDK